MRSEIRHYVPFTHFTCHVVLDIVLDFIPSPQDYVKTCLALRSLSREHETELRLLGSTRPGWNVCISSWKFTSPEWLISLNRLWRFYDTTHHVRLHVDASQTEIRDNNRVLTARWRLILKLIVDTFYNRCPYLRTADDSVFHFEAVDQHTHVWNWITDSDMMIFSKCRNIHIEFADFITDRGLMLLRNTRELSLYGGKRVTGEAFCLLAGECQLRQVIITGFPELTGYDDVILSSIKQKKISSKLHLVDMLIRKWR